MRIIVFHDTYGCDTGCCGHRIEATDEDGNPVGNFPTGFTFGHPFQEDHLEWAKDLIADEFGIRHMADLDWSRCVIVED